jgi:release factor glutamine methyltransferase
MLLRNLLNKHKSYGDIAWEVAEEYLDLSKEEIIIYSDKKKVSPQQEKKINKALLEFQKGTPLAYCLNRKYFFGYKFYVDKNTLIPRPETEILVKTATPFIKKIRSGNVIDIGTGCANIIISLYKQSGDSKNKIHFFAVDKSKKALRVAIKNSSRLDAEKINFLQSDLFSNSKLPKNFEVILANLPYLERDYLKNLPRDLSRSLSYEPTIALDGGKEGFELIVKLIKELKNRLSPRGVCIIEIGDDQIQQISEICISENLEIKKIKDFNGFARFARIRKRTLRV